MNGKCQTMQKVFAMSDIFIFYTDSADYGFCFKYNMGDCADISAA